MTYVYGPPKRSQYILKITKQIRHKIHTSSNRYINVFFLSSSIAIFMMRLFEAVVLVLHGVFIIGKHIEGDPILKYWIKCNRFTFKFYSTVIESKLESKL